MTTQTTQPTTDQITVRVTLDSYDFAHPSEKQTQVYVQIPEVARVSYMLPAARFHGLKDRAWPEVLDVAQEYYEQGWVIDPSSAVARQAVMEWLRDSTNRDEMQVAYEEDQARQNPVLRNLRARITELEADREANDREYEQATARIAALENERHTTNEALSDAAEQLRRQRDRIAVLEKAAVEGRAALAAFCADHEDPGTAALGALYLLQQATSGTPMQPGETVPKVYRASHDSIVMGLYLTREAAQQHCEASARASISGDVSLDWDEDELTVTRIDGSEYLSGYVVDVLEIAAECDAEADR
ncbi:hypothetical protein AB0E06_10555 [Streptomyces sp. NPDC048109]|uniref:hypothetical protein n=1 Tax=Streptomyces sp. NPDC048109 TaxID=3155482 RepID=UPI0034404278